MLERIWEHVYQPIPSDYIARNAREEEFCKKEGLKFLPSIHFDPIQGMPYVSGGQHMELMVEDYSHLFPPNLQQNPDIMLSFPVPTAWHVIFRKSDCLIEQDPYLWFVPISKARERAQFLSYLWEYVYVASENADDRFPQNSNPSQFAPHTPYWHGLRALYRYFQPHECLTVLQFLLSDLGSNAYLSLHWESDYYTDYEKDSPPFLKRNEAANAAMERMKNDDLAGLDDLLSFDLDQYWRWDALKTWVYVAEGQFRRRLSDYFFCEEDWKAMGDFIMMIDTILMEEMKKRDKAEGRG